MVVGHYSEWRNVIWCPSRECSCPFACSFCIPMTSSLGLKTFVADADDAPLLAVVTSDMRSEISNSLIRDMAMIDV